MANNQPMTAIVEYQVRRETTTVDEWLVEWDKRAEDAQSGEPETSAYAAALNLENDLAAEYAAVVGGNLHAVASFIVSDNRRNSQFGVCGPVNGDASLVPLISDGRTRYRRHGKQRSVPLGQL